MAQVDFSYVIFAYYAGIMLDASAYLYIMHNSYAKDYAGIIDADLPQPAPIVIHDF